MIDLEAMRRDVELANPSGAGCDLYAAIDAAQRCSAHVLALLGEVERLRAERDVLLDYARLRAHEHAGPWGYDDPVSFADACAWVAENVTPAAMAEYRARLIAAGELGEGWGAPDE